MELLLISDCNREAGEDSHYNKIFKVPRDVENLPECSLSQTVCSPLRDRVMVKVITSLPEVQVFLSSVKKYIDAEITERSVRDKCREDLDDENVAGPKPDVCRMQVCVCCSTGICVSVSCVERLYEVYTTEKPVGLTVEREHKRGTTWAKKQWDHKNLLWQCTKLPVTYFRSVKELTDERMWNSFPLDLSHLIEEQFQRDPFNSMCEVQQEKSMNTYKLNFETGEVYSSHEMKTYQLCCVCVCSIQDQISCSMMDLAAYKSMTRHYGAAGILFYTFHPITGEPVFLLGHMTYSCESWCDFGGLKSYRERPRKTAARESSEETLGVVGSVQSLQRMLDNFKENNVFKVVNQNTAYVCHFLCVPYDDYPNQFMRASLDHMYSLEMDELRWFSMSSLREAMNLLSLGYKVQACPILENGCVDYLNPLPMRYEFIQTLCIAQKLNILHSIEHITQQLFNTTQQQQLSLSGSSPVDGTLTMENMTQKVKSFKLQSVVESGQSCSSEECPVPSPGGDGNAQTPARGQEEDRSLQQKPHAKDVTKQPHAKDVTSSAVVRGKITRCKGTKCSVFKFGIGGGKIS